jgi:hypothetical protein
MTPLISSMGINAGRASVGGAAPNFSATYSENPSPAVSSVFAASPMFQMAPEDPNRPFDVLDEIKASVMLSLGMTSRTPGSMRMQPITPSPASLSIRPPAPGLLTHS